MEVEGRKEEEEEEEEEEGVRRLSDRGCYRASPVPHPVPDHLCRACTTED